MYVVWPCSFSRPVCVDVIILGFYSHAVSIQSFSFSVWCSINRTNPQIDSGCLQNSSITVMLKMQIQYVLQMTFLHATHRRHYFLLMCLSAVNSRKLPKSCVHPPKWDSLAAPWPAPAFSNCHCWWSTVTFHFSNLWKSKILGASFQQAAA